VEFGDHIARFGGCGGGRGQYPLNDSRDEVHSTSLYGDEGANARNGDGEARHRAAGEARGRVLAGEQQDEAKSGKGYLGDQLRSHVDGGCGERPGGRNSLKRRHPRANDQAADVGERQQFAARVAHHPRPCKDPPSPGAPRLFKAEPSGPQKRIREG